MNELKQTHPQISDGGIGKIINRVQNKKVMAERKKYKMIQVGEETHKLLKDYCEAHGFKISGLLQAIVKQYITKPRG